MPSRLDIFFAAHPVFTVPELDGFLVHSGTGNTETRQALLRHHQQQGHILRIRRGLYAAVPAGAPLQTFPVDPFLVASRLADDAVLAYHTALAFHGIAHTVRQAFTVLSTQTHVRPLRFQGVTYQALTPPAALQKAGGVLFGVETRDRAGLDLHVTGLERTLVDVLDRPALGGGWEEIWRSFEDAGYLDVDRVVAYALLLDNAATAARVGYFLELHRDALRVEERHLGILRGHRPRQPRYLDRQQGRTHLVPAWNLMVPEDVSERSWQEVL